MCERRDAIREVHEQAILLTAACVGAVLSAVRRSALDEPSPHVPFQPAAQCRAETAPKGDA